MARPGSFYDSKGNLYVDCSECTRGGNGNDKNKCSAGRRITQKSKGGCFLGSLIDGIKVKK